MKIPPMDERTKIIDAAGLILGRMASIVAKRLLNGEKIIIVNAEKAVISGDKYMIIEQYHDYLQRGHLEKGPLHPRRPDRIVRRAIRGMLPYKRPRGRDALNRLKVYMGVPAELRGKPVETINEASASKLKGRYITVLELSQHIKS
ncbi:MAG: 50S ribosomal protein L13 [Candidatus Bathyarchaeia archaeon]